MNRMHINISGIVRELTARNNVQIHSLSTLDPDLRNEFGLRKRKALFLFRSFALEAFFSEAGSTRLLVSFDPIPPGRRPGERVLVILPRKNSSKKYVLQTFIKNIFTDRIELQVMDPRYYKRIRPAGRHSLLCRPVPQLLLLKLQTESLDLVRETGGFPRGDSGGPAPGSGPPRIEDLLCDPEGTLSERHGELLQAPPLPATLVDFSCGGMSLILREGDIGNLPDGLLHCHLCLGQESPGGGDLLDLKVFAAVRSIRKVEEGHILHLMFLGRLPGEVMTLLEQPPPAP